MEGVHPLFSPWPARLFHSCTRHSSPAIQSPVPEPARLLAAALSDPCGQRSAALPGSQEEPTQELLRALGSPHCVDDWGGADSRQGSGEGTQSCFASPGREGVQPEGPARRGPSPD
eukprot:6805261-Heterocapsa_arctica.AAC.1